MKRNEDPAQLVLPLDSEPRKVSGDLRCIECGREYRKHPFVEDPLSGIHQLCSGVKVSLT